MTSRQVPCLPPRYNAQVLHHHHPELSDADYVIFADSSRRYVDCTEAVCTLLGYTREEILRKTVDDISYNVDEVPQLFAQYLKAGAMEGEYVVRHKDGTPIPIHFRAFVFKDGCNAAIWKPTKDWREPYLAALLEVDPAKLKSKLDVALAAINRARDSQGPATQTPSERQAMADAASALNSLLRSMRRSH
jgi:PAS domain S-box-containing protein